MGARGPAKTPTAVLKARGSWKVNERKDEPQPELGIPEPVGKLTGLARELWDLHCEKLSAASILSQIDGGALERYCRASAKYQDLVSVDISQIEVKTVEDLAIVERHTATLIRLSEHLMKIEVQYGMTPASRPNVKRLDREKPAHGNSKNAARFIDMAAVKGRRVAK